MEPRVAQWIADLPADLEPEHPEPGLAEMLQALSRKPVPASRLTRSWALGTLQAKVAAGYAWYWMRTRLADDERRALARNEAHVKAAIKILGGMSYLRGAILKVGQTLAGYPALLPRQYVEVLNALHFEAPPMHYSLLREFVRRELGDEPERLFAEFDTQAFAAASLGQVHRARLHSGEEVAVKVQYPNIARTIRADLANLKAVLKPLRLTKHWDYYVTHAEDIEATLLLETDYVAEARNTERARELLSGLDEVVVPRVHPELSTGRILTLDYLAGVHPHRYTDLAPSQEERDRAGERILRALYRIWCNRIIAADPNPGNFLVLDDGRIGLLDFGCFRRLNDQEWAAMELGAKAVGGSDEEVATAIEACIELKDGEHLSPAVLEALRASCEWLWEPLYADGPFDFRDEAYLRRGIETFGSVMQLREVVRHIPAITWLNRSLLGIRGLLHTLGARVDYRRINDEELARANVM